MVNRDKTHVIMNNFEFDQWFIALQHIGITRPKWLIRMEYWLYNL